MNLEPRWQPNRPSSSEALNDVKEFGTGPNPRPFDEVNYLENPSQDELRALALEHTPAILQTGTGSLNKLTRNKARMAKYTYIIGDDLPEGTWSHQTISRTQAAELIALQESYIREQGTLIAIDGYVGLGRRGLGATWLYTPEGANIAGMQQVLNFPRTEVEATEELAKPFVPTFTLHYTPGLKAAGMPGGQAILVDLEAWTTYVIGPDYFGESKKGVLRMLNHYAYLLGGLVLHAGAKAVTLPDGRRVTMTVMGLSGTGKTTTSFSEQGDLTEPIQDDMVTLWPGGEMSITENGCFAKIEKLSADSEPIIHAGTTSADAWVENAYLDADGGFDFFKTLLTAEEVARYRDLLVATGADPSKVDRVVSGEVLIEDVVDANGIPEDGWDFVCWTGNGRSIIPMSSISSAADLHNIPPVKSMGILNRDEGAEAAMPGILRFTSPEQAAGFFMLGETSKTSAAGKERGKTRSPFTQPFFPAAHRLQAVRFRELAATMSDVTMWLMNTGYVGGEGRDVESGRALKVKIRHSSAMLEALLSETIVWKRDPDFGYETVDVDHPDNAELVASVGEDILEPRRFYSKAGRMDEYGVWVARMKTERRTFLENYEVSSDIVAATVG
ncbi:MAG: phosphoenolpyruvate carboxykinase (ATP) [Myxococcota bacterium]|nr:phosphoenolpyruvate carboxykinase (ATP) [Myxococcota bacterium]